MSMERKRADKVVLFPGLVDKLVNKGMDNLKEKNLSEALSYFQQSLEIEPDHPQGRFGVALCFVELGRLEEAREQTEQMLKEDIGNYYDILQVHISLLVQLGKYREVVTMLEGLIAEEKLPIQQAESIYHLLHFSRQMVEVADSGVVESYNEPDSNVDELIELLYSSTPEKQRVAIQMLGKIHNETTIHAFKQFLKDEKQDPVLKSFILQMLKENKVEGRLEVHKFGKNVTVSITELEDVFHEKFGETTLQLLAQDLENDNPTLLQSITQVWWHFLFAVYPISPQPVNPSLWAAALYKVGGEISGMDFDETEIANRYDQKVETVRSCAKQILTIETESFKGT